MKITKKNSIFSSYFIHECHLFQVELSQPEHCERDIWDLLEECWNRDEDARPTFSEMSMFLKRKSLAVTSAANDSK